MALWKPFRGNRARLDSVEKHEGYVYFCTDDGSLFFDYTDADGVLQRKQINAKDCETLCGLSLEELKSDLTTQDALILSEAQAYTDAAVGEALDGFSGGVGTPIVTTSGTGSAYTATIEGLTELKVGYSFIMIPHVKSDSNIPTLNVNNLGAKDLFRNTSYSTRSHCATFFQDFFQPDTPYRVMFHEDYWVLEDYTKPVAEDLSGRVPVYSGGVPKGYSYEMGRILQADENGEPFWSGEIPSRVEDVEVSISRLDKKVSNISAEMMTLVTYGKLKALRDKSQLVPGMFYRITDYQCTTTQENTRAVDATKFDIIVQALSSNTLSETASAIAHGGKPTLMSSVFTNKVIKSLVTPYYYEYIDFDGGDGLDADYRQGKDLFVDCDYLENNEGEIVPVIYKTAAEGIDPTRPDYDSEFEDPDYADAFYYVGIAEIDGTTYDKWRKIDGEDLCWDSDSQVYVYTNQIVQDCNIPLASFLVEEESDEYTFDSSAVRISYCEFIDYNSDNYNLQPIDDKVFAAYDYLENNNGTVVPVLYDWCEDEIGYNEEYYYDGKATIDGEVYDRWRKIELGDDTDFSWTSTSKAYYYTNVIVEESGTSNNGINFSAWELKYSLDNDTTRFAWADDNVTLTLTLEGDEFGGQYIREPSLDNPTFLSGSGRSAWLYAQNQLGDDEILVIYTTASSEKYSICEWARFQLQEGEYVCIACGQTQIDLYFGETAGAGRGVIYYMKDEHNNECPYDFKNIQYKRCMITETEVDSIGALVGHYFGITDGYNYTVDESDYIWCYTFSWLNENDEVEDLSIVGQKLTNDEGNCPGVYSNVINTISACPDNPEQYGIALNDIVCLSEWGYEEGLFYGCYSNTFGNDCRSNTFGDSCYCNTLGNDCNYNTFGNDCYSNTFGNDCPSNTFSNNCYSNTFDNYCYSNTFGDNCYSNTFGNYCSNTFGKDCHENTFDNNCYENTFGDYCNLITFGNNCSYNTFGADTELVTYAKLVYFAEGCQYIKLICSKAGDDENYLQDIVVSAGVRGTAVKPRELQVSRNAPPMVFEAANTTHVVLDD